LVDESSRFALFPQKILIYSQNPCMGADLFLLASLIGLIAIE